MYRLWAGRNEMKWNEIGKRQEWQVIRKIYVRKNVYETYT